MKVIIIIINETMVIKQNERTQSMKGSVTKYSFDMLSTDNMSFLKVINNDREKEGVDGREREGDEEWREEEKRKEEGAERER